MSISSYLSNLRAKIGPALVLMPGVAGIVRDVEGRVLLQRRTDNGEWSLPAGSVDPGEEPAQRTVGGTLAGRDDARTPVFPGGRNAAGRRTVSPATLHCRRERQRGSIRVAG